MRNFTLIYSSFIFCLVLSSATCKRNVDPNLEQKLKNYDIGLNGVTISSTKPSDVWPPRPGKYFALDCGGTHSKIVDGVLTRNVELRGWLTGVGGEANSSIDGDWRDWHYKFEPDLDWCIANNIDINKLIKVGNIMFPENDQSGLQNTVWSPRSLASEPVIVVELNGWTNSAPPLHPNFTQLPADWTHIDSSAMDTKWPFNPKRPLYWQPPLESGQYVRMVGSILTDAPHQSRDWYAVWMLKLLGLDIGMGATYNDAKKIWGGLDEYDPNHPGRYTEMHPPDIISVMEGSDFKPKTYRLMGVAVCEDKALFNPGNSFDADMIPLGPKPGPNARAEIIEMLGPETVLNTIVEGEPDGSGGFKGARITKFPDHVHVHVKVKANTGSNGKFKALYKVYWKN